MTSLPSKKSFEDLLESLNVTVALTNTLMGDMRDQSSSLVVLKAKLESLTENVESLSRIVRNDGGSGSMVTRLALLEMALQELKDDVQSLRDEPCQDLKDLRATVNDSKALKAKEEELRRKFGQEQVMTKLKIAAIVTPGLISLAILIVKMFATGLPE